MSETLLFARGRLGVCWRTASGGGGRLGQRQNQPLEIRRLVRNIALACRGKKILK